MNRFLRRKAESVWRRAKHRLTMGSEQDPNSYKGWWVWAMPSMDAQPEFIEIKHVKGSLAHQTCYEINGTHLVEMFSFHKQLTTGELPTKEEMHEWYLATQITGIKEINSEQKEAPKPADP